MADTAPVLELRGMSKRFGAVQALYDVDLAVHAGEVIALVGDNGAGKSTLIKCIGGIHPTDGGEIRFEGRPVATVSNGMALLNLSAGARFVVTGLVLLAAVLVDSLSARGRPARGLA